MRVYNLYWINSIATLNSVQSIVFKEKGVSPKNAYVSIGCVKYERPKKTNLADHTDPPFCTTK